MNKALEDLRAQGKQFLSSVKDANAVTRGLFKESAPRLLKGYLNECLHTKTNAEVYTYLKQDLWEHVPESQKQFLESYRPWPLEWLTVEWVRDVVAMTHPAMALSIDSSEMLKESITKSISSFHSRLA